MVTDGDAKLVVEQHGTILMGSTMAVQLMATAPVEARGDVEVDVEEPVRRKQRTGQFWIRGLGRKSRPPGDETVVDLRARAQAETARGRDLRRQTQGANVPRSTKWTTDGST
ncbi:hypothetical protein ON010_g7417 [Phytophthora cinnamomi]|nr:hypothetical protein ON010_g7417 [Phytophthora cinnamomi]